MATTYMSASSAVDSVFKDGGGTEVARISASDDLFSISRSGHIIPGTDITKQLGGPSNRWYIIWGINFQTDSGDSLNYDRTNDRWLFYVGGTVRGYVDATGFHDGAP